MRSLPILVLTAWLAACSGGSTVGEAPDAGAADPGGAADTGQACARPCGAACCGAEQTCNPVTLLCERPCQPQCAGRTCGSDGCGGSCGGCPQGTRCDIGLSQCVHCMPQCQGKQCGDDGCGGTCGGCQASQTCSAQGQCVTCQPQCQGRTCGPDSCGGTCGSCLSGQACTAAGTCQSCTPSCSGKVCGDDGCGGQCGSCSGGQTCDGSGQCQACQPQCQGKLCGPDSCGGSCGSCSGGQTCSASGQCSGCVPSCGGKVCGDNGCGGQCGSCPTGQTCQASGQCLCVPQCGGKMCGDDGCGGSCGSCGSGQSCGLGGVCGLPCLNCPPGFSCDGKGACTAPPSTRLDLEVRNLTVAEITLNGAQPTTGSSCTSNPSASKVKVTYKDPAQGYSFDLYVPCSSADFSFSHVLYPGNYEVRISGMGSGYSNLPTAVQQITTLTATGPLSNLVYDMKNFTVSGKLTVNGAQPTTNSTCTSNPSAVKARVNYRDTAQGYSFDQVVLCSSADFSFTHYLFPGNYEVRVSGEGGGYANLPTAVQKVTTLAASTAQTGLIFDMRNLTVSGKITVNGAQPTTGSTCTSNPSAVKARVNYRDDAQGYSFDQVVLCSSADFSFTHYLFPGNYEVRVSGEGGGYANLPTADQKVTTLVATSMQTGLVYDMKNFTVSGKLTVNGAQPTTGSTCTSNPSAVKARVNYRDTAQGYSFDQVVLCSSADFSFTHYLFPGNYEVRVSGEGGGYANLPTAVQKVTTLAASTAQTGLIFDMRNLTVSGKITVNGAQPTTGSTCTSNPSAVKARVNYRDDAQGYSFDQVVLCSSADFSFTHYLFPGNYEVRVSGEGGGYANLPTAVQKVTTLAATSMQTGLVYDMKNFTVTGKLLLNGAQPTTGSTCTSNPSAAKARVNYRDDAQGYSFDQVVLCSSADFSFTHYLYPGTYEVRVSGEGGGYSNLPTAPHLVSRIKLP